MFEDNLLTIFSAVLQSQQRKSVAQVQVWLSHGDNYLTVSVILLEVVHLLSIPSKHENTKSCNGHNQQIKLTGELMLTELGFACDTCWMSCS